MYSAFAFCECRGSTICESPRNVKAGCCTAPDHAQQPVSQLQAAYSIARYPPLPSPDSATIVFWSTGECGVRRELLQTLAAAAAAAATAGATENTFSSAASAAPHMIEKQSIGWRQPLYRQKLHSGQEDATPIGRRNDECGLEGDRTAELQSRAHADRANWTCRLVHQHCHSFGHLLAGCDFDPFIGSLNT